MKDDFTLYDKSTGRPHSTGRMDLSLLDYDHARYALKVGYQVLPGEWIDASTGKPKPAPVPSAEEALLARRQRMSLTPRQLFIGLHEAGFITAEEAVAAAATGAMPAALTAAIAGLDPADQANIAITWARMGVALRTDPLVALLAAAVGATDAEIDAFFEAFDETTTPERRRKLKRASRNG